MVKFRKWIMISLLHTLDMKLLFYVSRLLEEVSWNLEFHSISFLCPIDNSNDILPIAYSLPTLFIINTSSTFFRTTKHIVPHPDIFSNDTSQGQKMETPRRKLRYFFVAPR